MPEPTEPASSPQPKQDDIHSVVKSAGVIGVATRRNALIIFMSVELMLNAANLAFVAFASVFKTFSGQIFVFFVIAVAAAEVAVGLALIVEIFKTKHTINVDEMNNLKE